MFTCKNVLHVKKCLHVKKVLHEMTPARGPQTEFPDNLCCAIFSVPSMVISGFPVVAYLPRLA